MAITGIDAYGPFVDTGVGTQPTTRASVEVEVHNVGEIDSGSKIVPPATTGHIPHRDPKSPR